MPDLIFDPPVCPQYPQKKVRNRVHVARFGNGYEQRAKAGINANREEWTVAFAALSKAHADAIETFMLDQAGSHTPFKWTVPGGAGEKWYQLRPDTYTRTQTAPNWYTIRFTIEQSYGH